MHTWWIYLLIINILSAVLFSLDKSSATKNRRRIPEKTLHLFELLGGVFSNLFLMYVIRHKNRKIGYFGLSWVILVAWIFLIYFMEKNV